MKTKPNLRRVTGLAAIVTVSVLALLATAAVVHGQTRGPSAIYDAQTTGQQGAYNRIVGARPPFLIGWNWGAMLLGPNTDLATNFQHMENPWRWVGNQFDWTRPYFSLNNLPNRSRLAIAPSDPVPEADIPTMYEWYEEARRVDTAKRPRVGFVPLDVGKGTATGLSESMGMRFHPELDMSDTTHFVAKHGTRQPAAFGFREKWLGTTTTDTAGGADLRWHLAADGITDWEPVLGSSWPQQDFGRWRVEEHMAQWSPFNGRRMVLGIHVRRTDTTDTAMTDEPVLRLRVMTQRMNTGNTIAAIRFDSLPSPTAAAVALPNCLDGTGRGLVRPMEITPADTTVEDIVITQRM